MLSHLALFIFYTLAMAGILLIAFVVYKKFNFNTQKTAKGIINILDSYPIGAKKNLLVVKVMDEKFLIASDMERTAFLAKLDTEKQQQTQNPPPKNSKTLSPYIKRIMQNYNEQEQKKERQEERDVYDFLYSQSKKIEKNDNKSLADLYMTKRTNMQAQEKFQSKKELMNKLLKEIHQAKRTGAKFNG